MVAGSCITKQIALQYRDGLLIALLAAVPLRRRSLAALRIGTHLVKAGAGWALDIPARDTKAGKALEFSLSGAMSDRIDIYLKRFRPRIPGATKHHGLWASDKAHPMDDGTIYDMVRRRTLKAFGFAVILHRFRHAAATFWSIQDPKKRSARTRQFRPDRGALHDGAIAHRGPRACQAIKAKC